MVAMVGRSLTAFRGYDRLVLVTMVDLAVAAVGGYGRSVLVAMVGLAVAAVGGYGRLGVIGPCSSFRQQRAPTPISNVKPQAPPLPNLHWKAPTLTKKQLQLERKAAVYRGECDSARQKRLLEPLAVDYAGEV